MTGSRIAYGGCYDRNDAPDEYCDAYAKEELKQDWNWFCMSICDNYVNVLTKGEHCDNIIRCDEGSSIERYCVDKKTFWKENTDWEKNEVEYCIFDRYDACQEQINGSRCKADD